MPKPVINIQMLGSFTLRAEGMPTAVVGSLSGRSRRLWTLIAYLIVNKDRGVPAQELIDILWPDGAGSNPVATLQNNVSRSRAMLKEKGFDNAKDLIAFASGLYYWAPDMTTVLDVDIFEKKMAEAEKQLVNEDLDDDARNEALNVALEALSLYKGDFLSEATSETWSINLSVYYRSLYSRLAQSAVHQLSDMERYADVERVCTQALFIDPTVEEFSIYLMRALVAEGNPAQALEHYEATKRLFEKTYGVSPSAGLEIEHAAALHRLYGEELPEDEIRSFLFEDGDPEGAFYCNNTVFREIVQLHMRDIRRSKSSAQIAVISVEDASNASQKNQREKHALNMRRLESAISLSLRSGDPFTKMTSSQFLMLLPSATPENARMIMERIAARFRHDYPFVKVHFRCSVFSLTDLM